MNGDFPLSNIIRDGGMMNIFLNLGCIGDSLSSGELEYDKNGKVGFWDYYDYSWGKQIERITGIKITNFSKGGLTAYDVYHASDEHISHRMDDLNSLFNPANMKQGYFIALGANDMGKIKKNTMYDGIIGNVDKDICLEDYTQNGETFVGYYARIIQRLQSIQPDTKFFLITMPKTPGVEGDAEFAQLLHDIAGKLQNCYVIDLYQHAPVYDEEFRKKYFDGHMNGLGYLLTAHFIMTYTDWIIRNNLDDFRFVPFIGTDKKPHRDL